MKTKKFYDEGKKINFEKNKDFVSEVLDVIIAGKKVPVIIGLNRTNGTVVVTVTTTMKAYTFNFYNLVSDYILTQSTDDEEDRVLRRTLYEYVLRKYSYMFKKVNLSNFDRTF